MITDAVAATAALALALLLWAAALIPRAVISDRHMWPFTPGSLRF